MGTYLMTGLKLQMSLYHDKEQLPEIAECPKDVYACVAEKDEDGDMILVYRVHEELLRQELIPFLREFYSVYYEGSYRQDYQKAIDFLETHPYEEWQAFFKEGKVYECRLDSVETPICLDDDWKYVNTDLLRLAFEGKVMAEEMDAHLNLYNYALQRAFTSKLSVCLHTQIVG